MNLKLLNRYFKIFVVYPPESEASRKVANLTERKNLHTTKMVSKNLSVYLPIRLLLFDLSSNQNQKPIEKKFARLAATFVFVRQFFSSKTANL